MGAFNGEETSLKVFHFTGKPVFSFSGGIKNAIAKNRFRRMEKVSNRKSNTNLNSGFSNSF